MKKECKKFIYTVLIGTLIGIIAFGTVNFIVNPYRIYSSDIIKVGIFNHQKLTKAIAIIDKKPEVIFIGSSRTRIGIEPQYYQEITGIYNVYNAGCASMNIYEAKRFVEHAVANQPNLKEIFLGLDFYAFNENEKNTSDFIDAQMGKNHITNEVLLKTLLSKQALLDSINCIKDRKVYQFPQLNDNGKENENLLEILKSKEPFGGGNLPIDYKISELDRLHLTRQI